MTETGRKGRPQEQIIGMGKEAAIPDFVAFSWRGSRAPNMLIRAFPPDKQGNQIVIRIPVGYMRDGIVLTPDNRLVGIYERVVDHLEQPEGPPLNEILFYPTDPDVLRRAAFTLPTDTHE